MRLYIINYIIISLIILILIIYKLLIYQYYIKSMCLYNNICIRICYNEHDIKYNTTKLNILKNNKTTQIILSGTPCIGFFKYTDELNNYKLIENQSYIMNIESGNIIDSDNYCFNEQSITLCIPIIHKKNIEDNSSIILIIAIILLILSYIHIKKNKYFKYNNYFLLYIQIFILKIIYIIIIRDNYYNISNDFIKNIISYIYLLINYILIISLTMHYIIILNIHINVNKLVIEFYKYMYKYVIICPVILIIIIYILNDYNIIKDKININYGKLTFVLGSRLYEIYDSKIKITGLIYLYSIYILCILVNIFMMLYNFKLKKNKVYKNILACYNIIYIIIFICWYLEIISWYYLYDTSILTYLLYLFVCSVIFIFSNFFI